jgi:hypothetical protein
MISPVKRLRESNRSDSTSRSSSKQKIEIKHPLAGGVTESDLAAFLKAFAVRGAIHIPGVLEAARQMKLSRAQVQRVELALRLMTARDDDFLGEEDLGYSFCSAGKSY